MYQSKFIKLKFWRDERKVESIGFGTNQDRDGGLKESWNQAGNRPTRRLIRRFATLRGSFKGQ